MNRCEVCKVLEEALAETPGERLRGFGLGEFGAPWLLDRRFRKCLEEREGKGRKNGKKQVIVGCPWCEPQDLCFQLFRCASATVAVIWPNPNRTDDEEGHARCRPGGLDDM